LCKHDRGAECSRNQRKLAKAKIESKTQGHDKTRGGRIEKTPDRRVREAITLVFRKFDELGSLRQVLLWFRQEQIALPVLVQDAKLGDRVLWRLPIYNTILKFLQNPIYAGAYAFGRTMTRTRMVEGVPRKTRGHRRSVDEWITLLPDHHEGYIPWEMKGLMVKGAPRHGRSLLSGLLRCGHCGRRLHVRYGGKGGRVTRYDCRGANINHGADGCISFGGLRIDEANRARGAARAHAGGRRGGASERATGSRGGSRDAPVARLGV
jgi:hypothetical protein